MMRAPIQAAIRANQLTPGCVTRATLPDVTFAVPGSPIVMPSAATSPSRTPTDLAVVDEIRAGDHAQFAVLVRRYNQRLFRTARAILGDDIEAEDAVQQAYLDAYRNLDQFRGEAGFGTWLTRITVNAAIARLRGRRRLAEVTVSDAAPSTE